ncbi:MAG: adenylate/guanylate cyclase domain-containing protein [Verrucomicrobia subdivision 3 bacterium]|nr:adenylate/guanylate cyclase domain-containing protein [Limisphaerales bacterium]
MKASPIRSIPVLTALGVVALVLALDILSRKVAWLDFLQRVEWITYDWRMRQASKLQYQAGTNFGFVSISDETIEHFSRGDLATNLQFGLYWPRHVYGRLVQELSMQGAKAVGLDVMFPELRPDHKDLETAPGRRVTSDHYFAFQLNKAANVVLGADPNVVPHPLFRKAALAMGGISTERDADGVLRRLKAFYDYRIWHPDIKQQARLLKWDLGRAHVTTQEVVFAGAHGQQRLPLTEDGLFDPSDLTGEKPAQGFTRLQQPLEDVRVWHLGIVLAAIELKIDLAKAHIDLDRGRITFYLANGGTRVLPVDRQGNFLVDWGLRLNDPRVTQRAFEKVIADHLLRQTGTNVVPEFRDKLVVVGSTATGNELSDRGATPLDKDTFLTSSHWNVINSMITGRFVRTAPYWLEVVLIVVLGIAGSLITCRLSTLRGSLSTFLLAVTYVAVSLAAFIFTRFWLPMVAPLSGLMLSYVSLVTYQALFEQSERQRIKEIFGKIVSPKVMQELLQAEKLSLGGTRRHVTVLFADIRGFTAMTDKSHARVVAEVKQDNVDPQLAEMIIDAESRLVLQTVNQYLGILADAIRQHNGTFDKYIGDCVMAFWGAPADDPQQAARCVRAAIQAQQAIHKLNEERSLENAQREKENTLRAAAGQPPIPLLDTLSLGTGINSGPVVAGLMGSEALEKNYTIFGREVNIASRLEKLSGKGRILIGEATYADLLKQDPAMAAKCIEIPPEDLRGIRETIKIYEVPWREEDAAAQAPQMVA